MKDGIDYLQLARGQLAVIYPQYTPDELELTTCRTFNQKGYQVFYAAVFIKVRDGSGHQLLETGPETDSVAKAMEIFVHGHLSYLMHQIVL